MSQLSDHYNRASAAVQPHYQKVQPYLAKGHKHAQAYLAPIDKELSRFPALNKFEAQTGVPKAYLGVGTFVLFVSFIFFNIFASLLTNALGFFIPAYYSLKALQSPSPNDDTQWLTYWTVFGFFSVLEGMADTVVYWFPFYYTGKALFLVWLMLPQTEGAKIVYANALRPLFFKTPKGTLPAGYYSSTSSTLGASSTSASRSAAPPAANPTSVSASALPKTASTDTFAASKATPPIPPRSSGASPAVPSSSSATAPLREYAAVPSHDAGAAGGAGIGAGASAPSDYDGQAAQAITAAQKAQALDGVAGHIPPDLNATVDALAHGDFVAAEAANPFR